MHAQQRLQIVQFSLLYAADGCPGLARSEGSKGTKRARQAAMHFSQLKKERQGWGTQTPGRVMQKDGGAAARSGGRVQLALDSPRETPSWGASSCRACFCWFGRSSKGAGRKGRGAHWVKALPCLLVGVHCRLHGPWSAKLELPRCCYQLETSGGCQPDWRVHARAPNNANSRNVTWKLVSARVPPFCPFSSPALLPKTSLRSFLSSSCPILPRPAPFPIPSLPLFPTSPQNPPPAPSPATTASRIHPPLSLWLLENLLVVSGVVCWHQPLHTKNNSPTG